MDWLVDDAALIYMLLILLTVALAVGWWRTRQRKLAIGTGVALGLILLVWLIGLLVPSDAKKIASALNEMSAGVRTRDLKRIFAQVSEQFQQGPPTFGTALNKEAFRQRSDQIIQSRNVEEVEVWDVHVEEISHKARTARVAFSAKPKGNWSSGAYYLVRADFVMDADGQWRLTGFRVFNPLVNTKEAMQIPGS